MVNSISGFCSLKVVLLGGFAVQPGIFDETPISEDFQGSG